MLTNRLSAPVVATTIMAAFAACDTGSASGTITDAGDGRVAKCTATLAINGTLTTPSGGTPPVDQGCVPQGTWNLTVSVADKGTCTDVPAKTNYTYTIAGTGRALTIEYAAEGNEEVEKGVHAGGNGECEGSFIHLLPASGGQFHRCCVKPFRPSSTADCRTRACQA